jgi:hypothetical protein
VTATPEHTGELPDLSRLPRTNFFDRLINLSFGMGGYPEPAQFQLTTAARLLDKALADWDLARAEFASHVSVRAGSSAALRSSRPGVTRALFRAIGHLEDLVDSVTRLLRLLKAMHDAPSLRALAELPLPDPAQCDSVRLFRNRISHGDEDIAAGKAGQGLATATLEPGPDGMELQGLRLDYADLATMLELICSYLRAASETVPTGPDHTR